MVKITPPSRNEINTRWKVYIKYIKNAVCVFFTGIIIYFHVYHLGLYLTGLDKMISSAGARFENENSSSYPNYTQCDDIFNFPCHFLGEALPAPALYPYLILDFTRVCICDFKSLKPERAKKKKNKTKEKQKKKCQKELDTNFEATFTLSLKAK